ncbi:glycine zipper 2TM domain-containing protein [Luteimonas sp. e5]
MKKRLLIPSLAIALGFAAGAASAQDASSLLLGYDTSVNRGYRPAVQPAYPSSGMQQDAQYDWARVISAVRVPAGGYASSGYGDAGQRCYTRDDGHAEGAYYPGQPNGGYYGGYPGGQRAGSQAGRTMASIAGGVVGAVLGSKVGGGSGRYATSAIGSMVGSQVAGSIYDQAQRERRRGQVTVCDPVPVSGGQPGYGQAGWGDAWDVTYEYNGRRYTRRMDHHPGDRVRVRVDVSPQ